MAARRDIVCWEALDPEDPAMEDAHRLYETTLDPAERIPWDWIVRAVAGRAKWRPGHWSPHLLMAGPRSRQGAVGKPLGFAYGAHVPEYGGYACYLGVDPRQRRRGGATQLLRLLIQVLRVDAACEGVPLPFVVWESRRPAADAPAAAQASWQARLRLFARVGAGWVAGLTFLAPNFQRRGGPPVPLQLFLLPVDVPAEAFDPPVLRAVAGGLLERVYGRAAGDPLYGQTLPPGCRPVLKPVPAL
jgi:hypothetical protein